MYVLPSEGFVREKQLIGDKKNGIPGILPFGHTTLWNNVKSGSFPKPIKLAERITAWHVDVIRAYIEKNASQTNAKS
jgi:prophage regulatory protein